MIHQGVEETACGIAAPSPGKGGARLIFEERAVGFRPALSLDDDAERPQDLAELDPSVERDLLGRDMDAPQHRMFGHRDAIQFGDFAVASELTLAGIPDREQQRLIRTDTVPPDVIERAKDWRLLLQVDTDEELGLSVGDGGLVYFMVRAQDAARADFSNVMAYSEDH